MRLLFRLEGRGTEHVPAHGPVLLVANHSSFLDPPLVGGVAPRPLSFMAKAELFRGGWSWLTSECCSAREAEAGVALEPA